jgi:hypothetical protein
MRNVSVLLSIVLAHSIAAGAAKPTFTSTWKANVAATSYAGKKVVGLIVSDDMNLRMSAEEALARQLTANGVQGVAAYRLIPGEEVRDKDRAKAWFERTGVDGVVIMRLIDLTKEKVPTVIVWQGYDQYSSLWSYYPYAWGATYQISTSGSRTLTTVTVETLVFDVSANKLLWAGTSETTNPDGAQALVASIVDGVADQMRKDGLIRKK